MRMFAHTALAANWLVRWHSHLWLRSDELMLTTRRACLVWAGMGLLCAGIHLYYLPMVGLVLVGYAVRRALQKRGPGGCAGTDSSVLRCGAGGVGAAGGRSLLTLQATPTATSAARLLRLVCAVAGTKLGAECLCRHRNIAGRGAGGVRHSLQRPQGEKFFAAHRDWLIAGAVVLVLI